MQLKPVPVDPVAQGKLALGVPIWQRHPGLRIEAAPGCSEQPPNKKPPGGAAAFELTVLGIV
jgi:hypothetical protein